MNLSKEIFDEIYRISNNFSEITKVVLFGSRARGDNHTTSDIDLAIFADNSDFQYDFIEAIDTIDTLIKFDLVFVTSKTDAKLLENIEKDHIIIMEKITKSSNYRKAVKRLSEAVNTCLENEDTLLFDGLIQRFEFSTELAWKACREKLLALGCVDVNGPKPVMREAFAHGLIDDEKAWIKIINDRNLTSHIYSDDVAKQICERVIYEYLTQFEKLAQILLLP